MSEQHKDAALKAAVEDILKRAFAYAFNKGTHIDLEPDHKLANGLRDEIMHLIRNDRQQQEAKWAGEKEKAVCEVLEAIDDEIGTPEVLNGTTDIENTAILYGNTVRKELREFMAQLSTAQEEKV